MSSTTLYTIGTALSRARDHAVGVRVLVGGHWIAGHVSDLDGQGVVLAGPDAEHAVVRIQDISAVRVDTAGPLSGRPGTTHAEQTGPEDRVHVQDAPAGVRELR